MKCVMIINENLPLGLMVNTSAVLAMSIGKQFGHLVGPEVQDQSGSSHAGITQIAIPMLKGNDELIRSIREKVLHNAGEIYLVDFCNLAQQSKRYDEYMEKMKTTPAEQLTYLGIGLYGPLKEVNKLTGSLALLR